MFGKHVKKTSFHEKDRQSYSAFNKPCFHLFFLFLEKGFTMESTPYHEFSSISYSVAIKSKHVKE
ncbi:hypothetical protein C0R09_02695 [Brevibacillus laterosporus]|nr:hypothetical protein C0R09_02695 [Brevibacillus laterosporus]